MAGLATYDRLAGELVELLRDQDYPASLGRLPEFIAWFNSTKSGGPWSDLETVDHCLCDESFFHACGRWFARAAADATRAGEEG